MFVYPVTNWILKPGRFQKKKGIMYAIAFLVVIASIKIGVDVMDRGPNYYQVLGVNRASNPLEIKRAYKKMAVELHPDKNPSPNAEEEFNRLKSAYDVLMDMELREVYNKFGEDGIKSNKRFDEYQMLLEIAIFYVTWGMLAYVLTLGKSSVTARTWIFTGEIVMLVAEVTFMLNQGEMPTWFLPFVTEHELILLLHALFPPFMNGCRCIGSALYVDIDQQTRNLLQELHNQNNTILLVLRDIQVNLQQGVAVAGSGGGGKVVGGASSAIKATPTGKLKELEERMKANALGLKTSAVAKELENSGKTGVSSFWWMLGLYIVFYYIFG